MTKPGEHNGMLIDREALGPARGGHQERQRLPGEPQDCYEHPGLILLRARSRHPLLR